MTLDERFAELRSAVAAEVVRVAVRVRAAACEAERAAALEEADRIFPGAPKVLEFLKTLAPAAPITPAQRFARVRVAEIQLYHAAPLKNGRASRDVYAALKTQIDAAREAYRDRFLTPANGTADYLHA